MTPQNNYKLILAYEGTDFHGWQQQDNSISIQSIVKKAIETYIREPIRLIGSGRTDAGVHALGQVAHFHTNKDLEPGKFLYSLNALLPLSIRALHLTKVPPSFHAQYSALGKIYHYHLSLDPFVLPMRRLYVWRPPLPLDTEPLKRAASLFIGTHDFTSFANVGSVIRDPIRTLSRLDVLEEEGGLRLEFEGNGFLYKMVRNITGTLVAIGSGRLLPEDVPLLLAARNRSKAPEGAPPQGLFLVKVLYDSDTLMR